MTDSQELELMFAEYVNDLRDALRGMDASIESSITEFPMGASPCHQVTLVLYSPPPPMRIGLRIFLDGSYMLDKARDRRLSHPHFVEQEREIRQPILDLDSAVKSALAKTKIRFAKESTQKENPNAPTSQEQTAAGTGQAEASRAVNQPPVKPVGLSPRRKMLKGVLLVLLIALVLFVLTLLVAWGVLPFQFAQILFFLGLAILGAATLLGALNNVVSLVEKLTTRR